MGILNTQTQIKSTATLLSNLSAKSAKIAMVGLSSGGLATALFLAAKYRVIGYDSNRDYISLIQQQKDPNKKIDANQFIGKDFFATNISNLLEAAQFFVVTAAENDVSNLIFKKRILAVAKHLKVGDVVVFQNNDVIASKIDRYISVLERISGLINNVDFTVAYININSPNKINTIVKSNDLKTRALVTTVFEAVTVLTVIKSEKQSETSVVANRIASALKAKQPQKSNYTVLLRGITSNKNCSTLKTSKAALLYIALCRKGIQVKVQDNHVLSSQVEAHYGIELTTATSQRFDAIVNSVEHDNYQAMRKNDLKKNSNFYTLYLDRFGFERTL